MVSAVVLLYILLYYCTFVSTIVLFEVLQCQIKNVSFTFVFGFSRSICIKSIIKLLQYNTKYRQLC